MPTTPCTPDPHGRAQTGDCDIDPCFIDGPDYQSTDYQPGHVAGGDIGSTVGHIFDCTVPTVAPSRTLPNTGVDMGDALMLAGGLLGLGLIITGLSRRSGRTPSDGGAS